MIKTGMFKRPIALALGGGGARGFAHIGVLRALEKAELPIELIVGTSMGAVVGGLYAQLADAAAVESKIRSFLGSPLFRESHSVERKASWADDALELLLAQRDKNENPLEQMSAMTTRLKEALEKLFPRPLIEECRIPFAAVAADLRSGEEIVVRHGLIADAVTASSAMPGIFAPLEIGVRLLADGAAASPVPVRAARILAPDACIVAVDVSAGLAASFDEKNPLSLLMRSFAVTGACRHRDLIAEADVLIRPHVKWFSWREFEEFEAFIAEGEQAAVRALPMIKKQCKTIL